MSTNKEIDILVEYKEKQEHAEHRSLEYQRTRIRQVLDCLNERLSCDDYSENDEKCFIETIEILQTTDCPDVKLSDIRMEFHKLYKKHGKTPMSDRMMFFLSIKKRMK